MSCILVPSHIHYTGQCKLLRRCIKSLLAQTVPADIYVSLSFEPTFKDAVDDIVKIPGVTFIVQPFALSQMEHIGAMLVKKSKYILIMFCDDDDMYAPNRVQILQSLYIHAYINDKDPIAVRECVNDVKYCVDCPEYWAYAITPETLQTFFKRMPDLGLLTHIFGDVYLRMYLRTCKGNIIEYHAQDMDHALYKYNVVNPNSTTGKIAIYRKTQPLDPNIIRDVNTNTFIYACIKRDGETIKALAELHDTYRGYFDQLKKRIDHATTSLFDHLPKESTYLVS